MSAKTIVQDLAGKWHLDDIAPIDETDRAYVFKARCKSQRVALKILKDEGAEDEKGAADFLAHLNGQACVNVLESTDKALLMEYCDGHSLFKLAKEGRDEEAIAIMAGILNTIHETEIPRQNSLIPLDRRFQPLIDKGQEDREKNTAAHFVRAADLATYLLDSGGGQHVLHGDMHHNNVLHDSHRGWLSIDPKGLVGARAYDCGNIFLNPWHLPDIVRDADRISRCGDILSDMTALNKQEILNYAYVHCALSEVWFLSEGVHSEHNMIMLDLLETFIER